MKNIYLAVMFENILAYVELTKPRVVLLMAITSTIGIFLASNTHISIPILIYANIGIIMCSASGAIINHVLDKKIDQIMNRTHNRPIATEKIKPINAFIFAAIFAILGNLILVVKINYLTAWLTTVSLVGYSIVYTVLLKRATPQNIVIGGLAGATPPLLGWTAVTNSIDTYGLLLTLIIFIWTPPHFWALAIDKKDEYALANIPVMPVTHGVKYTKWHIFLYTVLLFVASILPYLLQMSGIVYLIAALILGLYFIYLTLILLLTTKPKTAIKTFKFSISYLLLLFIFLLIDHHLITQVTY
jgi:protoheme IX farnesyltransferase